MPPLGENASAVRRRIPAGRIYLSVGAAGLFILSAVIYGFYLGDRLVSLSAPMVNVVTKIKLEAAIAGLIIEEVTSTGIVGGLEDNWKPLDAALGAFRRLAEGQSDWQTAFLPFQRSNSDSLLAALEDKLARWQAAAERRVNDAGTSILLDEARIYYQFAFFEFMEAVNRLEDQINGSLSKNVSRFRLIQWILVVGCLGLTMLVGAILFRFERHRTRYVDEVLQSRERLAAEIEEHKRTVGTLAERTQDVERSNRDLQQFAYVASHDLQEPLRMVSSYVKLLERRYKGKLDADADDFIGFAVDGAARMQRMIRDLLVYSRVGTHGGPASRTEVGDVLRQVLSNLQVTIDDSGAHITHDVLPAVDADPTQLMQLFQNLIANAVKFRGASPPRIHVSAARDGRRWVFSVRDNGIGFDATYTDRIFTIFQRLHTREDYPGTGIGLAICKKIVERHGGAIWAESQPGAGSTFYFSLPADQAA